jgi:hypothetical protein
MRAERFVICRISPPCSALIRTGIRNDTTAIFIAPRRQSHPTKRHSSARECKLPIFSSVRIVRVSHQELFRRDMTANPPSVAGPAITRLLFVGVSPERA